MAVFLDRIDAVPLAADPFSDEYKAWVTVLVDSLNSVFNIVEQSINTLVVPSLTSAQIITASATAVDGTVWYATDGTPPNLVALINGSLVQFTTTPFP